MNYNDGTPGPSSFSCNNPQGVERVQHDKNKQKSSSSGPHEAQFYAGSVASSFPPAALELLPLVNRPIPASLPVSSAVLVGSQRIFKLDDFLEPFCHGFTKKLFPSRYPNNNNLYDKIVQGSRVLWLSGAPETGLEHWTVLVFPPEHYLYVDKPHDLMLYDKQCHKGVVVRGELCPKNWSLRQLLHLLFSGTIFDTGRYVREDMILPMPRGCPRIVLSKYGISPSELMKLKYGWDDNNLLYGRMVMWILTRTLLKSPKAIEPGRLRVRYNSKSKGEEIVCDLGAEAVLPEILAWLAGWVEEVGERKKRMMEETGGDDKGEGKGNKAKKQKLEEKKVEKGLKGTGSGGKGDEEGAKVDTGVKPEATNGKEMTDSVNLVEETVFEKGES